MKEIPSNIPLYFTDVITYHKHHAEHFRIFARLLQNVPGVNPDDLIKDAQNHEQAINNIISEFSKIAS